LKLHFQGDWDLGVFEPLEQLLVRSLAEHSWPLLAAFNRRAPHRTHRCFALTAA